MTSNSKEIGADTRLNSEQLSAKPHGRCPRCKHVVYNNPPGHVCSSCNSDVAFAIRIRDTHAPNSPRFAQMNAEVRRLSGLAYTPPLPIREVAWQCPNVGCRHENTDFVELTGGPFCGGSCGKDYEWSEIDYRVIGYVFSSNGDPNDQQ